MESSPQRAVQPVRPIAPYVGGKRNLSRRLVAIIDAAPHELYAEAFVGMGGVFFRRTRAPFAEVINDASSDVVNLFRILQRHYQSFCEELKWRLSSRSEFERLMRMDPETLTDLERAARFLYVQRNAFGGKVVGRSFGVSYGPSRFDLTKLAPMLADVHERLARVTIERLPYDAFIPRYDRPGALFYCDPPYVGTEHFYGPGCFSEADHARLRDLLAASRGRWVLSMNDVPMIRDLYAGCAIEEVGVTYRVSGEPTPARELIITRL